MSLTQHPKNKDNPMFASSPFQSPVSQRFTAPGIYRPLTLALPRRPDQRLRHAAWLMFTRSLG